MFLVGNQRQYVILQPLYTAFLHSIKLSKYRIGIQFHKASLAVEQHNYLTKIVNNYIVYDLHTWPRKSTNNFKVKNCLFAVTSIVQKSDKEKYVYSGYGLVLLIVHHLMQKISRLILVLWELTTFEINGSFGSPEKSLVLILVKQTQNFVCVCIIMLTIVICLLMQNKSSNLKLTIKILNFQHNFVSELYLMDLVLLSLEKYFVHNCVSCGNVYNFPVDYCSTDKSDILNIPRYLLTKNNIK